MAEDSAVPLPRVKLVRKDLLYIRLSWTISLSDLLHENNFLQHLAVALGDEEVTHMQIVETLQHGLVYYRPDPKRPLPLWKIVETIIGKEKEGEEVLARTKRHLESTPWCELDNTKR